MGHERLEVAPTNNAGDALWLTEARSGDPGAPVAAVALLSEVERLATLAAFNTDKLAAIQSGRSAPLRLATQRTKPSVGGVP
jgi:hypothetical protein